MPDLWLAPFLAGVLGVLWALPGLCALNRKTEGRALHGTTLGSTAQRVLTLPQKNKRGPRLRGSWQRAPATVGRSGGHHGHLSTAGRGLAASYGL